MEDGRSQCTMTSLTREGREVATELGSEAEEREKRYFAPIFKIVMNCTKFWDSD